MSYIGILCARDYHQLGYDLGSRHQVTRIWKGKSLLHHLPNPFHAPSFDDAPYMLG